MKNRFIVKPVKIVWRSSMIMGNPVTRSFQKFGIYDRDWQNDSFYCPNPGGQFASPINGQKYRVVLDDKDLATKLADKMNELFNDKVKSGMPIKSVKFKILKDSSLYDINLYISNDNIDKLIIL